MVLRGMQALLAEEPDIQVVGQATTADEGQALARRWDPDVIVLPIRLGGTLAGIELCRSLKTICRARLVVFTSFTREVELEIAALAGADALVSKNAADELLVGTLREVHEASQTGTVLRGLPRRVGSGRLSRTDPLTEREEQILGLMVEGLGNAQIATHLTVEVSTVKTHVRRILRKLGVANRRDLLGLG